MLSNFEKFTLLMWKNYRLQMRRPFSTVIELIVPFIVLAHLICFRGYVPSLEIQHPEYHQPFNMTKYGVIEYNLAFAPNTRHTRYIIDLTLKEFLKVGPSIRIFESGIDLEAFLKQNDSYVGIEIESEYGFDDEHRSLNYSIRFPSELKSQKKDWSTDLRFEQQTFMKMDSRYLTEGFITIQHALFQTFLLTKNRRVQKIQVQSFPQPAQIFDLFSKSMENIISFVICLMIYPSCMAMLKYIMIEKEKQLKETMKTFGLHSWIQ